MTKVPVSICGDPEHRHSGPCELWAAPNRELRKVWKCGRCTVEFSPAPGDPDPTECPICGCPAGP